MPLPDSDTFPCLTVARMVLSIERVVVLIARMVVSIALVVVSIARIVVSIALVVVLIARVVVSITSVVVLITFVVVSIASVVVLIALVTIFKDSVVIFRDSMVRLCRADCLPCFGRSVGRCCGQSPRRRAWRRPVGKERTCPFKKKLQRSSPRTGAYRWSRRP